VGAGFEDAGASAGHMARCLRRQVQGRKGAIAYSCIAPHGLGLKQPSRHEQHMEESLARFEKESRQGILEAWLEYSPGLDVEKVMDGFHLRENPSSDEIIQIAMDFDDALVSLYKEVAEKANNPKVKALFKNLLQLEEKEKIQVARAAMTLWEM
jgi:hypothetical protein